MNMAKGLRVTRINHLVNVNTSRICVHRELISQSNIHVAIGGFGKLSHLGSFGCPHIPDPVVTGEIRTLIELKDFFVEFHSLACSFIGKAADELRVTAQVLKYTSS